MFFVLFVVRFPVFPPCPFVATPPIGAICGGDRREVSHFFIGVHRRHLRMDSLPPHRRPSPSSADEPSSSPIGHRCNLHGRGERLAAFPRGSERGAEVPKRRKAEDSKTIQLTIDRIEDGKGEPGRR